MKIKHIYSPGTIRTMEVGPNLVLCGSVITNVPIIVTDSHITVEDVKPGFTDDGVDFKDLSFE